MFTFGFIASTSLCWLFLKVYHNSARMSMIFPTFRKFDKKGGIKMDDKAEIIDEIIEVLKRIDKKISSEA